MSVINNSSTLFATQRPNNLSTKQREERHERRLEIRNSVVNFANKYDAMPVKSALNKVVSI